MNESVKNFIETKLKSTGRDVEKLLNYLENECDFYTSPASTKYHGAYEGGLAEHSVNVLDCMLMLNESLNKTYGMPKDDENSIILVALLHDLCKVNTYKTKQLWRKDANGKWESYTGYVREPDLSMGHGGKSVYLANKYVDLTDKESQAIFWHMGAYDKSEYNNYNEMSDAYTKNSLAYKLHTADMMATYVLENETIEWETEN
jgi:hypothetical protein